MERTRASTGTEWESHAGYSRAVRAGNQVHVAGTTAIDEDGQIVVPDDPHSQARHALSTVVDALEDAGASVEDVVRTRMYVTDIDDWEAIGDAHGAVFGTVRPAASMVEVDRLIDNDALVEIEATAIIEE